MKSKAVAILLASMCLAVAVTAFASEQSAVGTWKLNVQKSSYGTMAAPKFEELIITTDKADRLEWKLRGASSDGKTYMSSYNGQIDGKYHPLLDSMGNGTIAYKREGSNVSWTVKNNTGAVIETGRSQLSADGKTLTLSGTSEGPKGKTNFSSAFERVQ